MRRASPRNQQMRSAGSETSPGSAPEHAGLPHESTRKPELEPCGRLSDLCVRGARDWRDAGNPGRSRWSRRGTAVAVRCDVTSRGEAHANFDDTGAAGREHRPASFVTADALQVRHSSSLPAGAGVAPPLATCARRCTRTIRRRSSGPGQRGKQVGAVRAAPRPRGIPRTARPDHSWRRLRRALCDDDVSNVNGSTVADPPPWCRMPSATATALSIHASRTVDAAPEVREPIATTTQPTASNSNQRPQLIVTTGHRSPIHGIRHRDGEHQLGDAQERQLGSIHREYAAAGVAR